MGLEPDQWDRRSIAPAHRIHTCALTSRLRLLYVTGYSNFRSDIQFHVPSSVFNMYLINSSIATFDQRYYSGALSKAVTEHSGLVNVRTPFIFNGKRFTKTAAFAVGIRQTGVLILRR